MISAQSVDQVRADIAAARAASPPRPVVFTLAPQSVASMAARYNLPLLVTYRKIVFALRERFGAARVNDAAFARDIALLETLDEFLLRRSGADQAPLPLLASSCPGWVCYAEKAQGSLALPFMSRTKSPQQIMGSLVRHMLAPQLGCAPGDIYHIAVMPCFDKKLEASRSEFDHDVNCVIATNELPALLDCDFAALPEAELSADDLTFSNVTADGLTASTAGGSGGYAEFVLRHAPARLLGAEAAAQCTTSAWTAGRNKDLQTATVVDASGATVLSVAILNGFRNIQTLITWLKKGRKIDFVEVMACPSGCVNGGGQLRPVVADERAASRTDGERLLSDVQARYAEIVVRPELAANDSRAAHLWREWRALEQPFAATASNETFRASRLRTQFFARETVANPLAIKW